MTEAEVQKLRDTGISDATILELQQEEEKKRGDQTTTPSTTAVKSDSGLATPDPNTPSQVFQAAQAAGVPTQGQSPSAAQTALEVGKVAAGIALPFGLGFGVAKLGGRGLNAMRGLASPGASVPVNPTAINLPPAGATPPVPGATPPVPGQSAQAGNQVLRDFVQQQGRFAPPQGPVAPTGGAPSGPAVPTTASGRPMSTQAQQYLQQQSNNLSSQMRQTAASRVLPAVAVPAAVAAGGAAATGLAAGQMRAMTPEDRRKFYDNPMLGAMSGDAGLAAAIMNQGR